MNNKEESIKNSECTNNTNTIVLKTFVTKINKKLTIVNTEENTKSNFKSVRKVQEQIRGGVTSDEETNNMIEIENKENTSALTDDKNIENDTIEDAVAVVINVDKKDEDLVDEPASYGQQQQEYGYGTPYYQQQVVGGKSVYVAGVPPSVPVNAATMPAYRRPSPPDDYEYYRPEAFGSTFDSQHTRHKFVQRVYMILTVQLLYTTFFIALCVFVPTVKFFVLTNYLLFMLATFAMLSLYVALVCCINIRRTYPTNFIILALFTIAFAYILGVVSATYSTKIVLMSFAITATVCFIISVFACQTSIDVTGYGAYLCLASFVVFVYGFIAIIIGMFMKLSILMVIYAGLLALLFSMYLMYDTQQIMGGRRLELSEEEYIAGALCLYVDIMYIFWMILTICGYTNN